MIEKEYDIGVVLAHELVRENGAWRMSSQSRGRVEKGIELFLRGDIKKLILSGGREDIYEGNLLSDFMEIYAVEKGVEKKFLLKESLSRDTVGQLIFCKQGIINPLKLKNIAIITSSFHVERVKRLSDAIFGEKYNLGFFGSSEHPTIKEINKEKTSFDIFKKTFSGVNFSEDKEVLFRLLERHTLYSCEREYFERGLRKLIEDSSNSRS